MAVERGDIFTFRYFDYGERFHGSSHGMRYALGREPLENIFFRPEERANGKLRAYVWPEPLCFEKTEEEKKLFRDFEYSEEGVCQAIDWINENI